MTETDDVKSIAPFGGEQNQKYARYATYASVTVASFLIILKVAAWSITGSVSILASLLDSMMDAFASVVTLIAVHRAMAPATSKYRYGHGKAEPLAALSQAAFIAGSAVLLLIQAGDRLFKPQELVETEIGLIVMVISIVATLGLVSYQAWVLKRADSVAISADSLHYKGDLLANLAVIAALLISHYAGWHYADPILGVAIALFILWNSREVAAEALVMLMDRELPEEERNRMIEIARSYKDVLDVHDLRTRRSGPYRFVQMHVEFNGQLTLNRAHTVAEAIEMQVMDEFPLCEVMVHQDPGTPRYPKDDDPAAND